ncbi:MAG: hypothetical protein ACUZ8H_14290 [Candidatus Anammoxibacter sp.]
MSTDHHTNLSFLILAYFSKTINGYELIPDNEIKEECHSTKIQMQI